MVFLKLWINYHVCACVCCIGHSSPQIFPEWGYYHWCPEPWSPQFQSLLAPLLPHPNQSPLWPVCRSHTSIGRKTANQNYELHTILLDEMWSLGVPQCLTTVLESSGQNSVASTLYKLHVEFHGTFCSNSTFLFTPQVINWTFQRLKKDLLKMRSVSYCIHTYLSVQCGLVDIQISCLFVDSKHVTCALWLLTDNAVGDLWITCSSLVIIFPLNLHNKGSCMGIISRQVQLSKIHKICLHPYYYVFVIKQCVFVCVVRQISVHTSVFTLSVLIPIHTNTPNVYHMTIHVHWACAFWFSQEAMSTLHLRWLTDTRKKWPYKNLTCLCRIHHSWGREWIKFSITFFARLCDIPSVQLKSWSIIILVQDCDHHWYAVFC